MTEKSDEELAREIARECAAVGTLAYEVAMEASKLALAAGIAKGRHLERAEFVSTTSSTFVNDDGTPDCFNGKHYPPCRHAVKP